MSRIGCPDHSRLDFVQNPMAMNTLLAFSQSISGMTGMTGMTGGRRPRPDFASFFPRDANPLALELLQRMLEFHPDDRITVEEALMHPYLADFQGQMPEPVKEEHFDFGFEDYIRGIGGNLLIVSIQVSISAYLIAICMSKL